MKEAIGQDKVTKTSAIHAGPTARSVPWELCCLRPCSCAHVRGFALHDQELWVVGLLARRSKSTFAPVVLYFAATDGHTEAYPHVV